MQIKLIFTTKVSHLASFWKRNFLELGNGLFHLPENDREAWNRYQRWLWRNWTRSSVWNIPFGKTGLPLQMFRCSWKFSAGTTKKVMFHLLCNQIFQNLFVNGKQPRCWTLSLLQFVRKITQIVSSKIWSNDFKKSRRLLPSTLLAPATNIRTCKATKIHKLKPLTYELHFSK